MTTMKYGAGAQAQTPVKTVTVSLGSANANGVITLSDSLSNYQFIGIATYISSAYSSFDIIPVPWFKNPTYPYHKRFDTNGTYRHIQVVYTSDTSVTISSRTSLNVEILGIKIS